MSPAPAPGGARLKVLLSEHLELCLSLKTGECFMAHLLVKGWPLITIEFARSFCQDSIAGRGAP